jgi:hypothetical protein
MKVAYTINGLIGGLSGKSWSRKDEDFLPTLTKYLYKSLDDKILKNNDVDIFLFSWHLNDKDLCEEIYKPKKSLFVDQIKFDLPDHFSSSTDRIQAHYSRWYGLQEVMKLRKEYEKEKNIEYDLVVNARFDHYWNKDINFSDLDIEKVHLSKFLDRAYGWSTGVCNSELLGDLFIMNPENMDEFAGMFNCLNDYTKPGECPAWKSISHHMLTVWHLRKLGLLKDDIIEFPLKTCFPPGIGAGQPLGVHPDRKEADYTLLRYKVEMENLTREDIINELT